MIHTCSSELLFDAPCRYEGKVDTDKHAYSIRKLGNTTYYYHYLDWARSGNTEHIVLSSSTKKYLSQHLIGLWEGRTRDKWISRVLFSLGYNVNA